jgi:uncharacterized damage-inducible protein DinB
VIAVLARRFERLESARHEVESEFASLSREQLAFRPHAGSWTLVEVLDHIVLVERTVLGGARKPGVNRSQWRHKPLRRFLTWVVFGLGIRIRVPSRVKQVVPQTNPDPAEVLARWKEVRADMRSFLETLESAQLGDLAIKHPIAGPFAYRNFLAFLEWHLKHHRRQIGRLRGAPGFPGTTLATR